MMSLHAPGTSLPLSTTPMQRRGDCLKGYWTQSRLGRVRSCLSAEYKLMMSRRGLDSRPVLLDDVEIEKNLGDVLPIIESILKTLKAIHGKIETVRENKEEIRLLADRCDYLAISAILQCKVDPSVRDLKYLNCGVFDLDQLVDKCNELRRFDWDEMGKLEGRIDGLIQDASLDGVAALRCDLHELKGTLEALRKNGAEERSTIIQLLKRAITSLPAPPQAKQAFVPRDTPQPKPWHAERPELANKVLDELRGGEGPQVVGLVGESGSGKTTVTAQMVRDAEVQRFFADGNVWLHVDSAGEDRVPSLLKQLAELVHEDIDGLNGDPPADWEDFDGAAYVKRLVEDGHDGQGLKYLVVADNIWEPEIVRKLRETAMWVLVTARDGKLGTDETGILDVEQNVGRLTDERARQGLQRAAGLRHDVELPAKAVDELVSLCGGMSLDLEFVGRWSVVHGKKDADAWSKAASAIRARQSDAKDDVSSDRNDEGLSSKIRREGVLCAGFEDLAAATGGSRDVQKMFFSLAVVPDGHAFTVHDATLLLRGREYSQEDEAATKDLLGSLERWTVLERDGQFYRMHDAYMTFAREKLVQKKGDIRPSILKRWTEHISSMAALRSTEAAVLREMWSALENVGGESCARKQPYVKALAEMDDSNSSWRAYAEALAWFQAAQEDWSGARTTGRKLLEVEKRLLGPDHPFIAKTLNFLTECADRLGDATDEEQLRRQKMEAFDLVLAKTNSHIGAARRQLECSFIPTGGLSSDELSGTATVLRRGFSTQEAELGANDLKLALTMHKLAACIGVGRPQETERLLRRALKIEEINLGENDIQVASTLYELGVYIQEAGRLKEAEKLLRRVLDIEMSKLGEGAVKVAYTLHSLGICVREAGRLGEAEELLRRAIDIKTAGLGDANAQLAYTLHSLGVRMRKHDRLEEVESVLRRAVDIERAELGENDEQVAYMLHELGVCVGEAGRLGEAEEILRQELDIEVVTLGEEDIQVAYTLHELGVTLQKEGRYKEAESLLGRALDIKQGDIVRNEADIATKLQQLGVCVGRLGRYEEAEELLTDALEIFEVKLGEDDVSVAETLQQLGALLVKADRKAEAEVPFKRASNILGGQSGSEGICEHGDCAT